MIRFSESSSLSTTPVTTPPLPANQIPQKGTLLDEEQLRQLAVGKILQKDIESGRQATHFVDHICA